MNMLTILCVRIPIGRVYFKSMGVKKDSVPDMIKVELTYTPIKGIFEFSVCTQNFIASINIAVMLIFSSDLIEFSCG